MLRRLAIAVAVLLLGLLGLVAGGLWLQRTPDLPPADLEARYAAPPSRFILVDGLRLHYRDEGPRDGPVLLLLHGFGASLHTWDGWVAALSDRHRVIRLDLPGHGLTGPDAAGRYGPDAMAEMVAGFARALGLPRFALAGNSMGGHVAWRYALRQPSQVERLILVDAAGLPRDEPRPGVLALGAMAWFGRLVGEGLAIATPRWLFAANLKSAYGDPTLVSEALVTRYFELMHRAGNRRAAMQVTSATRDADAAARLGEIRQPVLILWGARDTWILPKYAEAFKAQLPHATLIIYPDLGHVPMEEAPARTAADAKRFLGG